MKVYLTELEEKIYCESFSTSMDRRTFKNIISKATLKYKGMNNYIIQNNEAFVGVYLVALMNKDYEIALIKDEQEIYKIGEGDWLGLIEYDSQRKLIDKGSYELHKWGLCGKIIKKNHVVNEMTPNYKKHLMLYEKNTEPCYIYEFRFNVILQ